MGGVRHEQVGHTKNMIEHDDDDDNEKFVFNLALTNFLIIDLRLFQGTTRSR